MNKLFTLLIACFIGFSSFGQGSSQSKKYTIKSHQKVDPNNVKPDFNAQLLKGEAPLPGGTSYRSFLMRQKIESSKKFPRKKLSGINVKKSSGQKPVIGTGMAMTRSLANGDTINYSGGVPNDNALAVSNGGIVLAAINNVLWAYDTEADSNALKLDLLTLRQIANGSSLQNYFDPKLIYDEEADRFILVFLRGNTPGASRIIVCFSSTNHPMDPWYVYELPGNPLKNNRWTDFPAVSLTKDHVYITGNLIVPGVTWQVGFDGSVIWQMDKSKGYANEDMDSRLYHDIKFNGKYTRNLHAVRGINSYADEAYFLSNRNFDITNDSLFIIKVISGINDTTVNPIISMGKTTPNYGVPPNGRQQDTDLNDPTKGLQTNDGRVLGAISNGDWIQFVSTTVNPATGLAAIYHGTIQNPLSPNQSITGTIYSDPVLDFGYPNIAFTGNEDCDKEAIVGFNFTSPTDFPGVACFYYGNDGSYSELTKLVKGENFTDAHSDSYERWGDYFGIQTKYNEPGKIWTAGYFGLANNRNGTWVNEVSSPDSLKITVETIETGRSVFCQGNLTIQPNGGVPPYLFSFNSDSATSENTFSDYCDGDTIVYQITDTRGCVLDGEFISDKKTSISGNVSYPNPFNDRMVVQFTLPSEQKVEAYIFDKKGKLVAEIINTNGHAGLNELHFDVAPLAQGAYVLKILTNGNELLVEKMIKTLE